MAGAILVFSTGALFGLAVWLLVGSQRSEKRRDER